MRTFNFDFTNTEHLAAEEEYLLLWRPMRSRLFRTCNMPEAMAGNEEFIQVCNTLSVNRGPVKGVYYFKVSEFGDFHDISMTFAHMGIEHLFAESEAAAVMTTEKGNMN